MNEAAIRTKLSELTEFLTAVPATGPAKSASEGVYQPVAKAITDGNIEESLDNLRLQVRYLMFDLEATRRENRYLRQMLESRPRPDRDDTGDDSRGWK